MLKLIVGRGALAAGVLSLVLPGTLVQGKERMIEVVAHRGASFDAPENTLSAIRLGWKQQADAVEFDIWLSKDGQIVLHHDADTNRTAGVEKRVDAQTFDELRQLDFGRWKNASFTGEPIPLLSEALQTIPTGKRVFIEIKCGPEVVPELVRVLAAADRPVSQTAVIAFSKDVCIAVKKARPDVQVYWLSSLKKDAKTGEWNHSARSLINEARRLGVDGLDLQAAAMITPEFVKEIRDAGLGFYVWTVNDADMARQMIAAGVQGITTDKPAWLREEVLDQTATGKPVGK